jgi:diaminopimelate decarboxylase
MDEFTYEAGRLRCEELDLIALADAVGTPTYVYSRRTFLDHFEKVQRAFAPLEPLICFSLKSCGNVHLARLLVEAGAGLDVVSGGELHRAQLAGCPAERIVFAGVGKTDREIEEALRYGHDAGDDGRPIGYFNVESEAEFENLAAIAGRLGVTAHAALRVNPDVDPQTHTYTTTGKRETKFGVDLERAATFFETYGRDKHLRLDALHLHLGSPIYSPEPYVEALERALALVDDLEKRGFAIAALDIGGGFGADYETGRSPAAVEYAERIVPLLEPRVGRGLRVILEPGRSIAANAGVLLTRVQYVKQSGDKRFLICDAGVQTLLRPALYDAFHFIWPARVEEEYATERRLEDMELPGLVACDIVGPVCESSDFLGKDRRLPPVERGDLLCVFTAGAYGMVMASQYNAHPRPAEVLVDGDSASVIRRRETYDDLLRGEEKSEPIDLAPAASTV